RTKRGRLFETPSTVPRAGIIFEPVFGGFWKNWLEFWLSNLVSKFLGRCPKNLRIPAITPPLTPLFALLEAQTSVDSSAGRFELLKKVLSLIIWKLLKHPQNQPLTRNDSGIWIMTR